MEHLKRTPFVIMLCLLSFFSCKPTDVISPKELNAIELEAHVEAMPEFQLYQQATSAANEALVSKLKNLNKKDAKWVALMHETYPSLETFITNAESLELATYKELTGLDLIEGNPKSNTHFLAFITQLQVSATYNSEDLAPIIFPDIQQKSIEKFFPTCASYCTYEAARLQRSVYSQCIQSISSHPSAASTCGKKAEMTYRYYLARCIKNCSLF